MLRAAIAAGIAPLVLPRHLLAGSGATPPSERINLGIIGLKKMGGAHVSTLLGNDSVHLAAVCDVDATVREATRQKVDAAYAARSKNGSAGGCAAFNEYERILEDPGIDAVLIAVPDHWHATITIAACAAGKDVYCEKPLSLTIAEGQAMVAAARRWARVVQTGTQRRSEFEFRHACELVRNGLIGDLKSVHVEVGPSSWHEEMSEQPVPAGFDYERWLGPAPSAPFNAMRVGSNFFNGWRRLRDYSGGKMTDWGAHYFDTVQWALGADETGPIEIIPPPHRTSSGPMPKIVDGPGASPADPSWGLRYVYASGVEVVKDGLDGVQFVGSRGQVTVKDGRYLRTKPESLRSHRFGPNDVRLVASDSHYQNWFDAIRTRRRPITDVAIGHRSASVCHLGNIALWLGRALKWDPAAERFVGDEVANRWLSRPRRAGWGTV